MFDKVVCCGCKSLFFPIPNGNVALGLHAPTLRRSFRVGSGSPRRTRLSAPYPAFPPLPTWWVAGRVLSLMPTR
eukprot:7390839-Prymnesium_polylepis.1